MKVTISKPAWHGFILLTVILVSQLFYIHHKAEQVGAAASPLRLALMVALVTGLALIVTLLILLDRSLQETSPRSTADAEPDIAQRALRSHHAALEAVLRSSRDGDPDPALVELANSLQSLCKSLE